MAVKGNGSAIRALLVDMALEDDEVRDWWNRGAYFIGEFAKAKQRFYPGSAAEFPLEQGAALPYI